MVVVNVLGHPAVIVAGDKVIGVNAGPGWKILR
jgi:hypothetical protein